MIERAPFGIYIVDSRFRIVQMNTGSQNNAFHNVRPVIGRDFAEAMRILWPEPVAVEIIGRFRHTLETGEPFYSRDFIRPRSDVEIVEAYEWELHRMMLPDGHYGVICYYFDSTSLREAEQQQRESQERLALAADAGQVGMFDLNMATGDLQWTQQHEVIFGYETTTTRTYRDWADRVHPEDLPMVEERMRQALEERVPFQVEYRLVWPDNSLHWVNVTSKYYFDDSGCCPRLMGAVRDITDQKQAEDALKRSEALYRSIGESIDYGVWVCAPDGRNIYASESFLKMVGITQEQCSSFGWGDVLHPEDADRTIAAWQECVHTGGTWDIEHRFRGVDGQWHHVLARGVPVKNDQGEVTCWAGINLDIDRLRQAEENLRDREERLRFHTENSPMAVIEWDRDFIVTKWTGESERIFGWSTADMVGKSILNLNMIFEDDISLVEQTIAQLANGLSRKVVSTNRNYNKNGDIIHCTWYNSVLTDQHGKMRSVLSKVIDITDRILAEIELQKSHDELEQRVTERTMELASSISHLQSEIHDRELAEKKLREETAVRLQATEALREKERMLIQQSRQAAMGEMIGNIAHQWRQPLNTLGLYTQRLGAFYGMPNFNKEFLDNTIAKSMEIIKHMSKTIDDFRDYFKPEKEKADFYMVEAIKSTLSLLEDNFQNPKITIDFVEHDNPVINGYQNEFAQVFLNILNNARDAIIEREIADARIIITIWTENNCAVVTVADNAGGISDEIIDKVFDPYFTTKGPQIGTGIGLFMSKAIIEKNMEGRLTVRNIDTGAEFRIEVDHGTQN